MRVDGVRAVSTAKLGPSLVVTAVVIPLVQHVEHVHEGLHLGADERLEVEGHLGVQAVLIGQAQRRVVGAVVDVGVGVDADGGVEVLVLASHAVLEEPVVREAGVVEEAAAQAEPGA
jgi:hypothetical protein